MQLNGRASLLALSFADDIIRGGRECAVFSHGEIPFAGLGIAARISEILAQRSGVIAPLAIHRRNKTRYDAPHRAIDDPLRDHLAVQMGANVKDGASALVVVRALTAKAETGPKKRQ